MLRSIPYKPLKRLIRAIRIRYYTVPWPEDVPSTIIEDDPESFEAVLRNWYGFEGMLLSYRYEGEALNLRRPAGEDSQSRQRELHIRAREVDDGLEVIGHVEASRYEHKTAHIEEDGLRWLEGDELEAAIVDLHAEDEDPIDS